MKLIRRIYDIIKEFGNSMSRANVAASAGESTLFIIISFFPFIMFVFMIMKHTSLTSDMLINMITRIVPQTASGAVTTIIKNIYSASSGATISVTAITLVWSASRGFLALVRGFNSVYEVNETRNYIKLRISSLFYTLGLALLILFTLLILVFGNRIFAYLTYRFPKVVNVAVLIISIRTIVSMGLYLMFFLILYILLPNRKSSIIYELPGALIASCGWLGFSYIYSYYVNNFSETYSMYGSLSTLVLLMVWLYFCINILFIGAQINHKIRVAIDTLRARKHS